MFRTYYNTTNYLLSILIYTLHSSVIKVKYILWFYKLYSRTLSRPEDPLRVEELEPNIFND